MYDFGLAFSRGDHERCLVVLVQGGAWELVTCFEEDLADVAMAERGGEVEVRVGEAEGGGVGVVEEGWM